MEELTKKQGHCPYCDSENLDYGTLAIEGEGGYYETDCMDCGEHFHEWYNFNFIGNWGEKEEANAKGTGTEVNGK